MAGNGCSVGCVDCKIQIQNTCILSQLISLRKSVSGSALLPPPPPFPPLPPLGLPIVPCKFVHKVI
jgi:hypothetical protein